jgi:hypothetical protein
LQVLPVALQILRGVTPKDLMCREKFVELRPRAEAEQPPQFGPAQMPELVFFERQRFERTAFEFAGGAEALREIVGNVNRDLHAGTLPQDAYLGLLDRKPGAVLIGQHRKPRLFVIEGRARKAAGTAAVGCGCIGRVSKARAPNVPRAGSLTVKRAMLFFSYLYQ